MHYAKSLDEFFANSGQWQECLFFLQDLLHQSRLEESLKWGIPVYGLGKKNLVGIAGFKSYVTLWFYQGALLSDPEKVLINAQEGVTKALRQWRFTSLAEIKAHQETILAYVEEATINQEQGREIKPERKKSLSVPVELQERLAAEEGLIAAFQQLSLSKRREYAEYISTAKQAATKQRRLDKIAPMIRAGVGLNDRYK